MSKPLTSKDIKFYRLIKGHYQKFGFITPNTLFKLGKIHRLYKTTKGYQNFVNRLKEKDMIELNDKGIKTKEWR